MSIRSLGTAVLAYVLLASTTGCQKLLGGPPYLRILPFEFHHGTEGWTSGFSGYSADLGREDLQLTFDHRHLPREADEIGHALYLAGKRRGDSLFMFVKKEIGGLEPDTRYRVSVMLKVTSTSPEALCEAAELPFDDPVRAYMKFGTFAAEPRVVTQANVRRFRGRRSASNGTSGRLRTIDTIEHSMRHCGYPGGYHVRRLHNHNDQLTVRTGEYGSFWAVVGLDTRFRVKTTFYIRTIKLFVRGEDAP